MEIKLDRLKEYFSEHDIEWRVANSGMNAGKPWAVVLAYVTNRAIMDRLDNVVGPENWKNEYREWHGNSQLCGISIRINGEWVTKWDGADNTNIESTKGGLSDSMKRAAVQWGIGRYLYNFPSNFAIFIDDKNKNAKYKAKIKTGPGQNDHVWLGWNPPAIPKIYLPKRTEE